MIIKKIKLKNIRSYNEKEISFSTGSTLLSGDIGSGKSTVLLAIDFALFGLSKGIITGEALLRHGQKEGSVELNFLIDNNDITIRRNLKKSGSSIAQDSGYIIINGEQENLSPIELKQRVLEILNYPQETLTKKSLIYRYTVYTPQEEMKSILLGDRESRLDTLRRIFNIDKYKRIQENSRILSSDLRLKIKEKELMIFGLEELKKTIEERRKKREELNSRAAETNDKILAIQGKIKEKKEEILRTEEKIKLLNEYRKDLEINDLNLRNSLKKINDNNEFIEKLRNEIKDLEEQDLKESDADNINFNIANLKPRILKTEEELLSARKSLNECKHDHLKSEKMIMDIKGLEKCPTCFQDVNDNHKESIIEKEEINLQELRENIRIYTKKENDLIKEAGLLKEEIEKLNEMKSMNDIIRLKLRNLNEKRELHKRLENENTEAAELIKIIERKKIELNSKINEFNGLNHENIRRDLDLLLNEEKEMLLAKNSCDNEIARINEEISRTNEDITRKEDERNKLFTIKRLRNFIDSDFLSIVGTIERKVMLRVHNDFNEIFVKWFNILIDDENISIRLDEEFSPVIEQNGYNVDYLFLSGGEKTAGALAYRLALNQVINNLISNVKTRDLLILDEPTDGFSEDQLDRMRLVLDEIDIEQIIIVSHESKIESFVNNVIRLNKKDGVSEIA